MSFITDIKFALRSLARVKGLTITVVATLALGIGANAAIFSVVRGVLLRPLVNKDEDRLIYISQSARGINTENAKFSVPEIRDLRGRVKTFSAVGEFSTIDFTLVGLGEPRVVRAGVVSGSYFEVMGLRPVLGRLLDATDDGPQAAGAAVLTHRFWTTALAGDPAVIGKVIRLSDRSATIIGVVEPSVPYPAQTEIIANIVTSPHHLSATMAEGRVHRMTDLFGRLAPGSDLDAARAELRAAHAAMINEHREDYPKKADFQIDAVRLRDQITSPARTVLLVLLAASALVFIIACSNVANLILARSVRREGELAIRAALGASAGALQAHAARGKPAAVRRRRRARRGDRLADGGGARALRRALLRARARPERRRQHALGRRRAGAGGGGAAGLRAAAALVRRVRRFGLVERQRQNHLGHQSPAAAVRDDADRRLVRAAGRRRHAADDAVRAAARAAPG